ncbi:MAG TPA: LCCL domain-containing protein [Planctomycetaceae bacterium]|jgi:hypothetical protein|nr:LCCL domain-containing protein [Planctomycetaceae bacterium]
MRSLTVPVVTLFLVSAACLAYEFPAEPFLSRVALREYAARDKPCPPGLSKIEIPRDLPAEAKTAVTNFQTEADAIRKKADEDIRAKGDQLAASLKTIQDQYTRDAKLDEAVAVRDLIRKLQAAHLPVLQYPGSLMPLREHVGETFYFEVTGRTGSSIWGTEVYTLDSDLGTAAVHIGALKEGETGIVQVTIVKSPEQHVSSTQNGVRSGSWSSYPASYTVQKWAGPRAAPK